MNFDKRWLAQSLIYIHPFAFCLLFICWKQTHCVDLLYCWMRYTNTTTETWVAYSNSYLACEHILVPLVCVPQVELCTLHLPACQVRVTVCFRALINAFLVVDFEHALSGNAESLSFCFSALLRSLLLCLCDVFRALIISLVCWVCWRFVLLMTYKHLIFLTCAVTDTCILILLTCCLPDRHDAGAGAEWIRGLRAQPSATRLRRPLPVPHVRTEDRSAYSGTQRLR